MCTLVIDGVEYRCEYTEENNLRLVPIIRSEAQVDSGTRQNDASSGSSSGRTQGIIIDERASGRQNDEIDDMEVEEDDDGDEGKNNSRRSRTAWKDAEVEKLIDICIEKHVSAKLDGKCGRLRHDEIFKSVAKTLNQAKLGIPKTYMNCKGKFKKLRETFTNCQKHNNTSGNDPKTCPYYDKLSILFSKRPRVKCGEWGYDSGVQFNTTASQDELSSTSSRATSPSSDVGPPLKQLPPKYRSGKNTSTTSLLKEMLEKEERESKAFWEQTHELLKQQEERDEKLLNGLMATMTSGLENIARMFFQNMGQPQQHYQGNPWNPPNYPSSHVSPPPSQLSSHVSPPPPQLASHVSPPPPQLASHVSPPSPQLASHVLPPPPQLASHVSPSPPQPALFSQSYPHAAASSSCSDRPPVPPSPMSSPEAGSGGLEPTQFSATHTPVSTTFPSTSKTVPIKVRPISSQTTSPMCTLTSSLQNPQKMRGLTPNGRMIILRQTGKGPLFANDPTDPESQ